MKKTKLLGIGDLFSISNANSTSSTWSTKTPQEILDDVNTLLRSSIDAEWSTLANGGVPYNWYAEPPEKFGITDAPSSYLVPYHCLLERPSWWLGTAPYELLMPLGSFWFLMRPTLALLLRSRKTRRPSKFTRRLEK
jgi:hypothetical protein